MDENVFKVRLFSGNPISANEIKELECKGYKPFIFVKKNKEDTAPFLTEFKLQGPTEVSGVFITDFLGECIAFRQSNKLFQIEEGKEDVIKLKISIAD